METLSWDERRRFLSEKAHEARKKGREEDPIVFSVLVDLVDWRERTAPAEMEAVQKRLDHLVKEADHLRILVSEFSQRLVELESRVHEDLE